MKKIEQLEIKPNANHEKLLRVLKADGTEVFNVDGSTPAITETANVTRTGNLTQTGNMAVTGTLGVTGAVTADVDLGTTWGAGLIGTGIAPKAYRRTENGVIITTYKIDLTGLTAKGTDDDCIGLKVGHADSYFDQYTIAAHGVLFKTEMIIVETLAGAGTVEVDLSANAAAKEYDEAVGDKFLDSGITAAGQSAVDLTNTPTADHYLHIVESDDVGDDSVFTAGQLIIILYGHAVLS